MTASRTSEDWAELLEQARSASGRKEYDRAERLYEQAIDSAQAALGRGAPEVFEALHELIHLEYCYLGSYARSEPVARRALALREEMLGPDHPELWRELLSLAYACQFSGKAAEAEDALRRAATLTERALGPAHVDAVAARGQFFQYLRNARRYDELERLLRPLVDTSDADERGVAPPIETLAWILRDQGRWAEAEPLYRRLLAQAESASSTNMRPVARWGRELANALTALGRPNEAIGLYERALELEERETQELLASLDSDPKYARSRQLLRRSRATITIEVLRHYSEALRAAQRSDEAAMAYERALGILEISAQESTPANNPSGVAADLQYAHLFREYAELCRELGRTNADDLQERAARLLESAEARRQASLRVPLMPDPTGSDNPRASLDSTYVRDTSTT